MFGLFFDKKINLNYFQQYAVFESSTIVSYKIHYLLWEICFLLRLRVHDVWFVHLKTQKRKQIIIERLLLKLFQSYKLEEADESLLSRPKLKPIEFFLSNLVCNWLFSSTINLNLFARSSSFFYIIKYIYLNFYNIIKFIFFQKKLLYTIAIFHLFYLCARRMMLLTAISILYLPLVFNFRKNVIKI